MYSNVYTVLDKFDRILHKSHCIVETTAAACKVMKPPEQSIPVTQPDATSHSPELNLKNLDEDQQNVVKMAVGKIKGKQQLKLFLHGPPGSGKTTVARAIARECRKKGMESVLIAVTGVAAKEGKGHTMHKCGHT